MYKNMDLLVKKVAGAYCVQRTRGTDFAELLYSEKPYEEEGAVSLGAFHGQETWVPSPRKDRRLYFALREKGKPLLWAGDTTVEIAAVENFRDMGGYRTTQGTSVKWGRFFRCGAVAGMAGLEREIYGAMGIRNIFDYRAAQEAAARPDEYGPETAYHAVPAIPLRGEGAKLADMDMTQRLRNIQSPKDADDMYQDFLSLYVILPFENDAYAKMLATLDGEAGTPIIQHCSAGKDRTGVGCALLLLALGVDMETVMQDYLLSAIYREETNKRYVAHVREAGLSGHAVDLIEKMMTVTRDMLANTYSAILQKYPSLEVFFQQEYGITSQRLHFWRRLHTV